MTDLVFFYGTLMRGLRPSRRVPLNLALAPLERGWIHARLFDLGPYPAAVPAQADRVCGEVHRLLDPDPALAQLDEFERCDLTRPASSLYLRRETPVTMDDGRVVDAWVYLYNAPLGDAHRIESGDYVKYLNEVWSRES
jgi:gamma-glutamylcyclotransferase (GGCT)/AIG2-like uncharacterized protein YtfP